jgi:CRP-like cAMP-binding protein
MEPAFERLRVHISEIASIDEAEFERLVGFFQQFRLPKKALLFSQGEVCRWFAFVHAGCLRTFNSDETGNEYTLFFAFPEWWVGDPTSFFGGTPARFSCQAIEASDLLRASREQFEGALESCPTFEHWYRIKMQRSYAAMQQKLVETNLQTAEEKYRLLLEKAPEIVQRIPQAYIASYLGIKPQSLSRIRKNITLSR